MPSLDPSETIAAIASPPGPAGRGIVRLSGPEALRIALARFSPEDGRPPSGRAEMRPGRIAVTGLRSGVAGSVLTWPGTRTYTGQPSAEIHTIGAPPVLQAVLADCLSAGARLAEPGEFTLRAFLSGRIDLTGAEAVLGVIEARTAAQLDEALAQLAGGIARPIGALRDRLLDVLAHLEADLDFADEPDVDPLGREALAGELAAASEELRAIADRLSDRDRPEGRPRVVLLGPPNAGKSLLFNALVGGSPALVSPIAGTTRDYLSAPCRCGGVEVDLIDPAGIEAPRDDIERCAQEARDRQLDAADLALLCLPADRPDAPAPSPRGRPSLRVATKCDLGAATPSDAIRTSGRTGEGLDALKTAIGSALASAAGEGVPGTSARCRAALERGGDALLSASGTLMLGGGDELVAVDLRRALDDLGRVVGAIVTDDVLDRIFARFCIGK